MPPPKQPSVRVVFNLEQVPADLGTIVNRWGPEPLADDEFTEGRIVASGFSDIEHKLSTIEGTYDGTSISVDLNDADSAIGSLLGSPATEFFINRRISTELLSKEGREAGLDWRPLLHGIVTDTQPQAGRRVRIELKDCLAGSFGSLSLDEAIGKVFLKPENHFGLPIDMHNKMYPHVVGEHTDEGTLDANGEDGAQGTLPLKFIGYQMLKTDGSIPPDGSETYMAIMEPPTNVRVTVVGTPGSRVLTYSVSAIVNGYGETRQSAPVTITNGPDGDFDTNYVVVEWDPPPQYGQYVNAYRVHGRGASPPNRSLKIMNNGGTWTNPEESWEDHGVDGEKTKIAPLVGTAQGLIPIDGVFMSGWGVMLVGLGAIKVTGLFASDRGGDPNNETEAPPKRVRIAWDDPDAFFPYLPGGAPNPAWPWPDGPWVTKNGIRFTVVGLKGRLLQDHLEGKVTAAVNGCGYDASGNQTGPIVDSPGEALKLYLNEFKLKNGGEGYRNGSFGPLELFPDGTPMINTTSFEETDDLTKQWLPEQAGYKAHWYVDDEKLTWRQFLQWYCNTFGFYLGAEQWGQIWLTTIADPTDDGTEKEYREDIEILDVELPPAVIAYNEVQTQRSFRFHFIPDRNEYRNPVETITDEAARIAIKGPHRGGESVVECRCSNDRNTVVDAQSRQLFRRSYPPIYQSFTVGMEGLEERLGKIVRLFHTGGGRGGYNNTPFFILSRRYRINDDHKVTFLAMNLARYQNLLSRTVPADDAVIEAVEPRVA